MLGVTIVSTFVIVIPTSNDWITRILACCFEVSTTIASNTIGGVMLTWDLSSFSLQLPIGIHCGVVCGCEYPSGSLILVKIDA